MLLGLAVLCLAAAQSCCTAEPMWNDLRVTWGMDPTDPNYFVRVPRTAADAESQGWEKIADCGEGGRFLGRRYTLGRDHSVILVFDVNGFIAGIQGAMLVSEITAGGNYYNFESDATFQPDVVHGEDVYVLSMYFIDPAIICHGGRSQADFAVEGTGTGLWAQLGPDPAADLMEIPTRDADCSAAGWAENHCFPTMGVHWHYNYTYDPSASCEDLFPMFMLYTEGVATGFGFQSLGNVRSKRWEDPGKMAIQAIFKSPPQCLYEAAQSFGLSTMHVYFRDRPWYIAC